MQSLFVQLAALTLSIATAVSAQMGPTLSGFLFDRASRTLNPILGIPGSAYVGSAVAEEIDDAWASPNRRWAVARRDARTLLITGIQELRAEAVEDSRLISNVSRVSWSADGTTAVLYSSEAAQIQRVRMSGGGVEVETPIDVGHLDGAVTAMALDDAGSVLLGAHSGVYEARAARTVRRIADVGQVTAIVYTAPRAYCLSGNSIVELAATESTVSARVLISDLSEPVGLAADADFIYTATAGDQKLRRFDNEGKLVSVVDLDRKPAEVRALVANSVFLLNGTEANHLPAIVFDTKHDAAVFFVPSGAVSPAL